MDIDPQTLQPIERYKLLVGGIVPRPIAWVSTQDAEGRHNLAPFSFYNGIGSNPMTLLFCPANRPDGSDKDTLRNCLPPEDGGIGQFVVNAATEHAAAKMAATAEDMPFGSSEFESASLTPTPSEKVAPPRVAESPLAFECETLQVIRTNPGEPGGGNVVLGRVVWIHAADGLIDGRMRVDPERLRAVGRMAGLGYCTTRDRFDLPWGQEAMQLVPGGGMPGEMKKRAEGN